MVNTWIGSNNQISTYTHIINHARITSAWFILPFCRSPICEVLSYRKMMHPPQRHGYVMFKSRMQQIVRIHDAVLYNYRFTSSWLPKLFEMQTHTGEAYIHCVRGRTFCYVLWCVAFAAIPCCHVQPFVAFISDMKSLPSIVKPKLAKPLISKLYSVL